jgi:hypothetical protein
MNSFEHIEFESIAEYEFLRNSFTNNSTFKIPFWKPDTNRNCNEVLIMINGFLEGVDSDPRSRNRHINRYDAIAKKVQSEKNIAVFLMPMPFHFDRSTDILGENEFAPLKRLMESGTYLYYGGNTQIISDINKLISSIENEPEKYFVNSTSEIKFHLLGYSLGGVAAIGSAIHLENSIGSNHNILNPKLESLSILLSAWNLSDISFDAIQNTFGDKFGLTAEKWKTMIDELSSIKDHTSSCFKKLIWDEGETIEFNRYAKRIIFLHGFKDDIFTAKHSENTKNRY